MLQITKAQLEIFRVVAERGFIERQLVQLRANFQTKFMGVPDEDLRALAQRCRNQAGRYQIVFEDDIRHFIECTITYGLTDDPKDGPTWITEILCHADLNGTQKMDVIDVLELQRIRQQP